MAKTATQEATPVTAQMPARNSVHFVLQGKGGVGKSLIAAILAQYFNAKGGQTVCIDTDPVNQTLVNYKALNAQHLPLLQGSRISERKFDALMERLLLEDGIFVVDNGASSFIPLSNYLIENDAIAALKDAGREVFIHCVVTGGQALTDTLQGFASLAEQTNSKNLVVWLNEFFGMIERDGKQFQDMKAYQTHADKVVGLVTIAQRNPDTFGQDMSDMASRKLTFAEAIEGPHFELMARSRYKTMQKDLFSQLDAIGF